MKEPRYVWKHGYSARGMEANVIGAYLDRIQSKEALTPKIIVENARSPKSPIHRVFEWDDSAAAEKWREEQAQHLIRHIVIIVSDDADELKQGPAYVSVVIDKQQQYVPTMVAIKSPDLRSQMLEYALRDLQAFEKKYREVFELQEVMGVIHATVGKLGASLTSSSHAQPATA